MPKNSDAPEKEVKMDTKTGRIYDLTDKKQKTMVEMLNELNPDRIKPMAMMPTDKQMCRRPPKVGRNDPCPCGSGKKFKNCCLQRG